MHSDSLRLSSAKISAFLILPVELTNMRIHNPISKYTRLSCLIAAWLIGSFCLLSGALTHAAPPGWKLVWSDEFEGSSLDTKKWDAIEWTTPFNNELQAYHPSRVTVEDGNLVLTADDEDFGGKSYTSGKVESKWTRQYGRFEVRAQLPGTQGTWPAIWLLPDPGQYAWPTQGEIDIMENRGNQPHVTSSAYHYGPKPSQRVFEFDQQRTSNLGQLDNYHDEFHLYAVEWDKHKLKFFVDDVHYFTVHDADVGGSLGTQTAPAEILLNVAVGGSFVEGAPPSDSSVWPQKMLVDYVRVYERAKSPPPQLFKNGGFEAEDGSLAGWSTFGNKAPETPNVLVHDEAVSAGKAALKLLGQFNGKENHSGVEQAITVSPGDSVSASLRALVPTADSIADSANRVEMKVDYYKKAGAQFGSADFLRSKTIMIVDGNMANDQWLNQTLSDNAPAESVEARLAIVFVQPNDERGSVCVDEVTFERLDRSQRNRHSQE